MAQYPGDETIIKAIVNLGKNLRLKVTAEGVESISQLRRLIDYSCDLAQGFALAPPMDSDAFTRFSRELSAKANFPR
jgi:EAL domain-containing protein (putative c-di-GMP-specific phosphodiesterase class I)